VAAALVTAELAAVEGRVAGAEHARLRIDEALGERPVREERLEDRPGDGVLNGPVLERLNPFISPPTVEVTRR
jgi:hypothetical protein